MSGVLKFQINSEARQVHLLSLADPAFCEALLIVDFMHLCVYKYIPMGLFITIIKNIHSQVSVFVSE